MDKGPHLSFLLPPVLAAPSEAFFAAFSLSQPTLPAQGDFQSYLGIGFSGFS